METILPELDYVTEDELSRFASIFSCSAFRERALFEPNKEFHTYSLLMGFVQRLRSVPGNS